MITGIVNEAREPVIAVVVLDANGREQEHDAIVDTGFNGWLSLGPALIARLMLHWKRVGRAILADGSETIFDVYEAIVIWNGHHRTIPVDESESEPLVGMHLMDGYELNVQAVIGGSVSLRPIG